MFDLGWTELLLIAIVALIVIGPKDLPGMFHTLGRVMAKVRSMGREFSRAMEDAARDSGMSDVTKDLRNIANPRKMGLDAVKDAATKFENWDPLSEVKSDKPARGPETEKLSKERAEAAEKIREATAKKAQARIDAEMEALQAGQEAPTDPTAEVAEPAPEPKTPAKKPAAKKTTAKASATKTASKTASKTATKKAPAKKAAPKKTAAKTTASKSTAAKKPAAKKTTTRKAPAKKADE